VVTDVGDAVELGFVFQHEVWLLLRLARPHRVVYGVGTLLRPRPRPILNSSHLAFEEHHARAFIARTLPVQAVVSFAVPP